VAISGEFRWPPTGRFSWPPSHPRYKERYQRTRRRLGRQRGAKVAQIELARKLTEGIWYMLTRNPLQALRFAGMRFAPDCLTVHFLTCATGASPDNTRSSKLMKR
jgi:hypothetical protein